MAGINAQESMNRTDFRDRILFGLKLGINYSNVYDAEGAAFTANPKLGMAGGIFMAIPITTYFGLQPEAMISQRGFQASGDILGAPYNVSRTTTYFDLPLFLTFKPSEFLSLLAGPQFSYLLKQTDVFENGITTSQQEIEFENGNIRKNILCFVVGADITMKHIVLSGRAGWDLLKNNGDGSSTYINYKNMWYQATIGYRLYRN
jgi:hypothetical protein